jgi:hypothetical protein
MKYEVRVAAAVTAGILIFASTLSGCALLNLPQRAEMNPPPPGNSANDLKISTVTYVREVCEMPTEQRDPELRDLNQSLLPNHAVIYCGRGGMP